MLTRARAALHRVMVRERLREIISAPGERGWMSELGDAVRALSRRAVTSGWTTRTTAAVVASIWIWREARRLEEGRRLRLGHDIARQERSGPTPLEWMREFESGRTNVVGIDTFFLRFNLANGVIASWIAERRAIDPHARRILLAMTAWGLSGMDQSEVETSLEELLLDLHG